MTFTRSHRLALLIIGTACLYACSSEDPNYTDAGLPVGVGGTPSGVSATPDSGSAADTGTGTGVVPPSGSPGATMGGTLPPAMAGGATTGGSTAGTKPDAGAPGGAGDAGSVSDAGASTGGDGGAGMAAGAGCTPAPTGTFPTMTVTRTGPDGNYTIYRPATLGMNGFLHPPVAWGNGLGTTPSQYSQWLTKVASNGFVVIANPGTGSDPQVVRQGLEWLIKQNDAGDYAGKLAKNCAGTIGYSMGGGAAVGSGSHPEVRAVVSVHGLQDAAEKVSGPLLLTTSDDDGFVTPADFVMPCYNRSTKQPTMMATYITGNPESFEGHLTPLGDGKQDADPTIAWLRYWLYGDQAQRMWFFGADCKLCKTPWKAQKKNYTWD
jgi:hypothetical protein